MIPSTNDAQEALPTRRQGARVRWAIALSLLVTLAFFLPSLSPSVQFGYFDNGRMHVPMKRFIADELHAGRFPAWNPYSGLGAPVAAGGVDAPQHPFNLLFLAFPFDLAFKLFVLLFFPIAALGGRALSRGLGVSDPAATVCGLSFSLCGYVVSMTGNMTYLGTLAFFPWILAAGLAFARRPGPGRALFVALASGLCAASGDPQGFGIAVALLPAAAAAFPPSGTSRRRAAGLGLLASLVSVLGALPFVLPLAAWIPNSGRSEPFDAFEYSMFNLIPARAAELFLPGLFHAGGRAFAYPVFEAYGGDRLTPLPWALSEYLGAGVAALAVLGAKERRAPRLLLAAAAVFTWMAMGSHAGFGELVRHLPLLGSFRFWEKLCAWPALLVTSAAGFGLEALLRREVDLRRAGVAFLAAGASLLLLSGMVWLFPGALAALVAPPAPPPEASADLVAHLASGLFHAGLTVALLGLCVRLYADRRLPFPALALGALCLLDLGVANFRAYQLFPVEKGRTPSTLAQELKARDPSPRIFTPFPLYSEGDRYAPLMERTSREAERDLYAAWNVPERVGNLEVWSGMLPVRFNRYWRRMGSRDHLPGVGMWAFRWVWVPELDARLARPFVAEGKPIQVPGLAGELYELPSRPRTYLALNVTSVDRRGAMEFVLDTRHVLSQESVVEAPLPKGYVPTAGEARIVVDEPCRVEIRAHAEGTALLVLNDVFTAGWVASVDGVPAEILPVNYLARGVFIPAGDHVVAFVYRTPWLLESWGLVAVAALLAALWALKRAKVAQKATKER